MAENLTKADVANQLRGPFFDKIKGVGNVLYENVVGGRIDDYESPGEKVGAGIGSFLKSVPNRVQSFVESPVESTRQAVGNLDSYLEDLYSRVSSEDPMAAMEAAQFAMTGGVGVALAKGYKVGELLDYDPNVAKIFIGPVGADNLADAGQPTAKKVLNIAKVMKLQGASSDEIRNATNKVIEREDPSLGGVSKNAAGAFVVELDDSKMDLRSEKAIRSATGGMQTSSGGMYFPAGIEKVLKGEKFSKAYPNEGSLQISTEAEAPRRGVRGTADPETGRVETFVERPRVVNVTAHELQHLAQFIENFPVGGNFEEAAEGLFGPVARDFAEISILLERYDGKIPDWEFEKPKFGDTGFANPKEAKKTAQQLLDEADGDADLASEAAMMQGDEILNSPNFYLGQLYEAVAGEVEARNVQTRLSMTAAERRATRPEDTEDIPRDQQVVVRGDGMVFDEKADGGEMRKGVGSLNDIARNMTRGPKGIGAYEQFANGGQVVGEKTGEKTKAGREIYITSDGEKVSEKSLTFEMNGLFVNVPSIFDGKIYNSNQVFKMLMDGVIKPTSIHQTEAEAVEAAKKRSDNLVARSSGGDVSGPPPLRGPNPQGFSKGGEGVIIPTKEDLDNMVLKVRDRYGFDPVRVATQEGVDPELALRIMFRESSGDHEKGSEKGALGLMQLMPITAKDVDVDRTDPFQNYIGGLRYLKKMQARFGPVDGIAAYNAGPTAVEKYEGIPPFAETQNYVRAVLSPFTGIDYEDQIQEDAETALMQMPVEVASNTILRPPERPPVFYTGPRPTARPEPQQMPVSPPIAPLPMPMDQNLQAKYSPQGIEQMLIGTTGGLPLPTPSPQGLPYSSMR